MRLASVILVGIAAVCAGVGVVQAPASGVRQGTCTSGKVALGRAPTEIRFVAHCRAPVGGGVVQASVGRYRLNGNALPGVIRAFSHRPRLISLGGTVRFGSCRRVSSEIGCVGSAAGGVRMVGRIHVKAKSRCRLGVALTTIEPSQCKRDGCPTEARVRTLASGRPSGC
jgi:hypothetical protein